MFLYWNFNVLAIHITKPMLRAPRRSFAMFTSQNPDPNGKKHFILWRPVVALWTWLVPPTQAHADRQPVAARRVAAALIVFVVLLLIALTLIFGRDLAKLYRKWRSNNAVKEAQKFERVAQEYFDQKREMEYQDTLVKSFLKASEAYVSDPDNPEAVRVAARIYTRTGQNQARFLWDKLQQLGAMTTCRGGFRPFPG
jgi:hypothetical protein